ncbi:hypothetical protein J6590_021296 [Homalodisca vitripennis]|nr:hypothetical protein J6590_021296 [Homalodisca vitripennis]
MAAEPTMKLKRPVLLVIPVQRATEMQFFQVADDSFSQIWRPGVLTRRQCGRF